jgi:hypothetical protein
MDRNSIPCCQVEIQRKAASEAVSNALVLSRGQIAQNYEW